MSGPLPAMLGLIDRFLELPDVDRDLFVVARRIGLARAPDDLARPVLREQARMAMREIRARFPGPIDQAMRALLNRFV